MLAAGPAVLFCVCLFGAFSAGGGGGGVGECVFLFAAAAGGGGGGGGGGGAYCVWFLCVYVFLEP